MALKYNLLLNMRKQKDRQWPYETNNNLFISFNRAVQNSTLFQTNTHTHTHITY